MENYSQPNENQFKDLPYSLPNTTVGLVLGIGSFFLCCFYSLGLITSGIALYLLSKDKKMLQQNPNATNISTYKSAVVINWIMLILNVIFLIFTIIIISIIGWENLNNPELMSDPEFIESLFR